MTNPRLALVAAGVLIAASVTQASAASDDAKTVGRVRVTTLQGTAATAAESVEAALASRFAPTPGKRFADRRIISVRPRSDDPQHFDATIYDYTVEKAFDLVVDAKGKELSRR